MRLLVIGGTVFLGRHVAAEALARGHELTLLHRGRHGAELFPEAEHLLADRASDAALGALADPRWDAVIDTCGFAAGDVAATTRALVPGIAHYVLVASANVYPDWPERPVSENSPVHAGGDDYGPQKAAAERAAVAALGPERVLSARAGLIVGPYDNIFRLPWWVARAARGGEMLAPGRPERELQLIDARDLARWLVDAAERRTAGLLNATAPIGQTTFGALLDAAVAATGSDAQLRWVGDDALLAAGVEPWTELPLWMPEAGFRGTWRVDSTLAHTAGLRCRPIEETVADVHAWLRDGGAAALGDWRAEHRPPGLAPEREAALLAG